MPWGAAPLLTEHNIAAALGMSKIPPGAAYLVRVKWAGQHQFVDALVTCLYTSSSDKVDYSTLSRKRSHYPGMVYDLARMAVAEYCLTSHVCKSCDGRKEAVIAAKLVKCGECGGSGMKNQGITREQLIGQFLTCHPVTFYRTWNGLYSAMLDLAGRWENVALGAVSYRLHGSKNA